MKSVYLYLFAAVTLLFAACSSDDDMNSTNATVSFEQAEFSFAESAKMVNVPIKVEGERNGNIAVHLKVTDGSAISEGHYIVTSENINIPVDSEDEVYNVQIRVLDDGDEENDDRYFTIEIVSADGASVGSNGTCKVVLTDVDKNPYFKLFGNWTVSAIDAATGEELTWDVNISNEGDDSNNEKYLVLLGWPEAGTYDAGIPWVLKYYPDGTLKIVDAAYFYAAYNFGSFIGAVCVKPMGMNGRPADVSIPGTYNSTFDEIVFDTETGLVGIAVHDYNTSSGEIGDYKGRYGNPYLILGMTKK